MSNTSRFVPVITLVGIIFLSAVLANTLVEQNQLPLFVLLFLIGVLFWVVGIGGGWRAAEKDTVVIVEDVTRTPRAIQQGSYLYIPIINAVAAKMPNYSIMHEFPVDAIDTRTPKMLKIQKITVGVIYAITDFEVCYDRSADIKQTIKDLEQNQKLKPDNPTLWIKALNGLMEGLIDEAIRTAVWEWAMHPNEGSGVKLETDFARASDVENDPYALSLNRNNLSRKVLGIVHKLATERGLHVEKLMFENIEIDQQMIDRATRNKDGEIAEAKHQAAKEAAAIREKGLAEAEVRAAMVAKVIEVMLNQERLPLNDQMIYNIVRAAMYSDGQMIWSATMEKGAGGSVKAA